MGGAGAVRRGTSAPPVIGGQTGAGGGETPGGARASGAPRAGAGRAGPAAGSAGPEAPQGRRGAGRAPVEGAAEAVLQYVVDGVLRALGRLPEMPRIPLWRAVQIPILFEVQRVIVRRAGAPGGAVLRERRRRERRAGAPRV